MLAVAVVTPVVALDVAVFGHLTMFFDVCFVLVCLAAALGVRPRDFFVAGVLPPLLLAATVLGLALVARDVVASPADSLTQALVSGLAHEAGALAAGYALALVVLALRQVAVRHAGAIRASAARHPRPADRPGPQESRRPRPADQASAPADHRPTSPGRIPEQRRPAARSVR